MSIQFIARSCVIRLGFKLGIKKFECGFRDDGRYIVLKIKVESVVGWNINSVCCSRQERSVVLASCADSASSYLMFGSVVGTVMKIMKIGRH